MGMHCKIVMGNEDSYSCAVFRCLPRSIEVGICGQLRKQIMFGRSTSTFGMADLYLSHSCTLNAMIISVACSPLISQPIHVQHPMEKGEKIEEIRKLITLEIGTTTRECK